MTEKDLLRAIGTIDEEYISEAAPGKGRKNGESRTVFDMVPRIAGTAAALIVLVCGLYFVTPLLRTSAPEVQENADAVVSYEENAAAGKTEGAAAGKAEGQPDGAGEDPATGQAPLMIDEADEADEAAMEEADTETESETEAETETDAGKKPAVWSIPEGTGLSGALISQYQSDHGE